VVNVESGETLFQLIPSDGFGGSDFGELVAIDDSFIAVSSAEAVYLYDRESGEELRKLGASEVENNDFGKALALEGGKIAVGAPNELSDHDDSIRVGSVYLFDVETGEQLARFQSQEESPNGQFGRAVALNGGEVVVSSRSFDEEGVNQGRVSVHEMVTYGEIDFIALEGEDLMVDFGQGLTVSEGVLIAGSDSGGNTARVGFAHLYSLEEPVVEVSFADPVLESVLLGILGKAEGPIFLHELEAITSLNLNDFEVLDFSGLRFVSGLESIDLRGSFPADPMAAILIIEETILSYSLRSFARPEGLSIPSEIREVLLYDEEGNPVFVSVVLGRNETV